jgi:hypothetical protein
MDGKEKRFMTRKLRYAIFAIAAVSLIVGQGVFAVDNGGYDYSKEILEYWHRLGDSSSQLNTSGELAWTEAYRLESLTDMYEGTGDVGFLRELVKRYDRIFANRDDKINMIDAVRGRVVAGWGCTAYTKGIRYVHAVHTGMIIYPAMKFCSLVKEHPELSEEFKVKADEYLKQGIECVSEFDGEWRENWGIGYYTEAKDYPGSGGGSILPYNMSLALGRSIIEIYRCTGDSFYKDKAEKLARWFKAALRKESQNRWEWNYQVGGQRTEDISHGALDVLFAVSAYREGIVFTQEDMVAFVNSLLTGILNARVGISNDVSGISGNQTDKAEGKAVIIEWIELASIDPKVYESLKKLWDENRKELYTSLGHAKILKWHKVLAST